jgi:hypothetical protein
MKEAEMRKRPVKLLMALGVIIMTLFLSTCFLFDSISGDWEGTITVDGEDQNFEFTLDKSGKTITGEITKVDDFYDSVGGAGDIEFDVPSDVQGTVDGSNVEISYSLVTGYQAVGGWVTITVEGTLDGTVEGDKMSGNVDASIEYVLGGDVVASGSDSGDFEATKN